MPKRCLCLAYLLLLLAYATPAVCQAGPDDERRYLILVSIDGFRWDYLDKYPTPALRALAARGVRADALLPVFPTLTFPNHYSMVTGLYPQNHGIVANEFPDPESADWYRYKNKEVVQDGRWYGGEPIWVAAARAGMATAAFYFVGTEADVEGIRPDRWHPYNKLVTGDMRTAQVLQWLAEPPETRPQMITLYFDDVDDHSHWSGVGSPAARAAIARVDGYIQQLQDGIARLPFSDQVSLVVASDHGQSAYNHSGEPFILEGRFNLDGITAVDGGSYLFLHFEQDDLQRVAALQLAINQAWDCGQAYRPEDAPASWMIGNNPKFPELILSPEPGCAVLSSPDKAGKINHGDHGWAPEDPDMHGIFMAAGPGIPAGLRIPPLRMVDIYPLLLRQLGLPIQQQLDSNLELWPALLDPAAASSQSKKD